MANRLEVNSLPAQLRVHHHTLHEIASRKEKQEEGLSEVGVGSFSWGPVGLTELPPVSK